MRSLLFLICAALCGCRSKPEPLPPSARAEQLERALEQGVVQPAALQRAMLPDDWQELAWNDCASWLATHFPDGQAWTLNTDDLRTLFAALGRQDTVSLRAIQILARLSDPLASEICVAHLERRQGPTAERPLAGVADTVCARALHSMPDFRGMSARLEALAISSNPHPSVDARVECAIRALALDSRRARDFLLAFARLGTRQYLRGASVPPGTDVQQAQLRALQALLAHAGVQAQVSALDPIEQRENLLKQIDAALTGRATSSPTP